MTLKLWWESLKVTGNAAIEQGKHCTVLVVHGNFITIIYNIRDHGQGHGGEFEPGFHLPPGQPVGLSQNR